MLSNKYSDLKIVGFPDKLQSFRDGTITAPIYVRLKPINRCNHDCFFCVYAQSNRKEIPATEDGLDHIISKMHEDMNEADVIPTRKMLEVLDDFKEIGVRAVTYSGGGETLH
jgi:MoaA/NifB/PqqE/SkfB family radical SAM enzyme